MNIRYFVSGSLVFVLASCAGSDVDSSVASGESSAVSSSDSGLECDPGNGDIELIDGFCAIVVADNLGRARHLAVADNGDVFVALREEGAEPGGVVALRDTDGDGRADVTERFGDHYGTAIEIRNGHLYFGTDS